MEVPQTQTSKTKRSTEFLNSVERESYPMELTITPSRLRLARLSKTNLHSCMHVLCRAFFFSER